MPSSVAIRKQRLRKTKAQLIDEIETLEQRLTDVETTSLAAEARLEAIIDNSPTSICLKDTEAGRSLESLPRQNVTGSNRILEYIRGRTFGFRYSRAASSPSLRTE